MRIKPKMVLLLMLLSVACQFTQAEVRQPFFYMVSIEGKTSFVLGTQHIGIDLNELPHGIIRKLALSRLLMTEIVYTPIELDRWFSDYVTAILNETKKYKQTGEPLSSEEKSLLIKNWKVPQQLVDIARSTSCGIYGALAFPTPHQMDFQIQRLAYGHGLKMRSLDTYEGRTAADEADSKAGESCDIREDIKHVSRQQILKSLLDMNNTYRAGDESSFKDHSPGIRIRNLSWMDTLMSELAVGSVFVEVGVDHLFGPFGILALLQAKGAIIKRLAD